MLQEKEIVVYLFLWDWNETQKPTFAKKEMIFKFLLALLTYRELNLNV